MMPNYCYDCVPNQLWILNRAEEAKLLKEREEKKKKEEEEKDRKEAAAKRMEEAKARAWVILLHDQM